MSSPIQLPAEAAARAAATAVNAARAWMVGMLWLDGLALIAMLGTAQAKAAHGATGGLAFGIAFWFAVLALVTLRVYRRVRRIRRIEAMARTSPTTTWLLDGRRVVPVNEHNIPLVDLTFKISEAVRSTLFAVPQARVVER